MLEKEVPHANIKNYSNASTREIDDESFHIRPLKKTRLIDSFDGLDDECEFEKNMFNFGDYEDLPPSDRSVDRRCTPN